MASNGDHVIDIIIETADRTQGGLNSARDRLLRFDESVRRTQQRLRQLSSRAYNVAINMIDNVTTPGSRINTFLH
ncbi:MAG: hypothetical protein IJ709_05915, partial [Selenomonas sp.]|nr:hypothetical protein [Selenomonas sp.]